MTYKSIACIADQTIKAQKAVKSLRKKNDFIDNIEEADAIIALGGDGFMLHCLHEYMHLKKPIYGMNCGTIGFLMNDYKDKNLINYINNAKEQILHPLKMTAKTSNGKKHTALAINEVSLLRHSKQAANIRISIDGRVRMPELVCDGVLLSTAAGSTAYNLSAHGPILPIGSQLLALTPISPFRPRRWKGALLPHKSTVKVEILDMKKRPVNAVADFSEVENVKSVEICEDQSTSITLLFDEDHSLEERIISEQFVT
ncbi:NAD kinase [Rickettsiales bacterium]|nr:NAD kinase [Rickettsiales bacterium]